jgi:hypothetical protein
MEFPATEMDRFETSPPYSRRFRVSIRTTTTMPFLMDNTLLEYADQTFETTRLGRNRVHKSRDLVFAEMLAELEANCDAMRFLDSKG